MANTERTLTNAELARKEAFEQARVELEAQGYRIHPLVISVVSANVGALATALPLDVVPRRRILSCCILSGRRVLPACRFWPFAFLAFVVLTVVHELVHGLTWSLFAKSGWKSVSFGVIWKYLTPYCTCNEALSRRAYIVGALMPTLVLGILPVLAAYATGSLFLLVVGLLTIPGGGGDLTIALKMLRFKPDGGEVLYLDHPYECGLVAFVR